MIVDGDDRYGEGVNIATRLEQLAEAGDVYVSGKVAKEVAKKLAFRFEAMGEQKVKNIDEPVPVYRVTFDGEATPKPRLRSPLMVRSRVLGVGLVVVLLLAVGASYGFRQWSDQGTGPHQRDCHPPSRHPSVVASARTRSAAPSRWKAADIPPTRHCCRFQKSGLQAVPGQNQRSLT